MRPAFLLLLLANVLLFAWGQGYFGARQEAGREPERLRRQLAPERLHLLPATPPADGGDGKTIE